MSPAEPAKPAEKKRGPRNTRKNEHRARKSFTTEDTEGHREAGEVRATGDCANPREPALNSERETRKLNRNQPDPVSATGPVQWAW